MTPTCLPLCGIDRNQGLDCDLKIPGCVNDPRADHAGRGVAVASAYDGGPIFATGVWKLTSTKGIRCLKNSTSIALTLEFM